MAAKATSVPETWMDSDSLVTAPNHQLGCKHASASTAYGRHAAVAFMHRLAYLKHARAHRYTRPILQVNKRDHPAAVAAQPSCCSWILPAVRASVIAIISRYSIPFSLTPRC